MEEQAGYYLQRILAMRMRMVAGEKVVVIDPRPKESPGRRTLARERCGALVAAPIAPSQRPARSGMVESAHHYNDPDPMSDHAWDLNVRKIHWFLALTVTFQQVSSLWMSDPGTQYLFSYHRLLGAVAAAGVALFWIYSQVYGDFAVLFPWGRAGRSTVWREARALLRGRLPATGHVVGLSGFVHGLGVLALAGCAVTGMILFAMIPPGHVGPPDDAMAFTRYTLMHKFFGTALWYYVGGHLLFAMLHQLAGDDVFRAIFRLSGAPRRTIE